MYRPFARGRLLVLLHVYHNHRWVLLYRDTLTPVVFVKVTEHASISSIANKVSQRQPFIFCKLLHHHYIRHEIMFHA